MVQEKLPSPFGLVRSGVAPDHPDTKNVTHHFEEIAHHPNVTYFGNTPVGGNVVRVEDLKRLYHAVVLAYGAETGRRLDIPGQSLKNIHSARDFVHWYNGHPDGAAVAMDGVDDVLIAGMGNVALDCARLLLRSPEDLSKTDISARALDVLKTHRVSRVHILARRGPAQAACTPKELRELLGLPGLKTIIHPPNCLDLGPLCQKEIQKSRINRRNIEVLKKAISLGNHEKSSDPPQRKELHVHFLASPCEYVGVDGQIKSSRVNKMELKPNENGQRPVKTDGFYDIKCEMAIESVGYRAKPIDGAPFDENSGTIPNILGKVIGDGNVGLFVCGWLKRGPTGIIGTNLLDAEQTVDTMVRSMHEWSAWKETKTGAAGLLELLRSKNHTAITIQQWDKIDELEKAKGQRDGKPREKITTIPEMLSAVSK